MKQFLFIFVLAIAWTASVSAQVSFDQDLDCTGAASVGRGCLKVEASLAHFADLRDQLTASMPDQGGGNVLMTCTQCSVDKGITGCAVSGDQVVINKRHAALHRIACILTNLRANKLFQDAKSAAAAGVDPSGDIGDGDPSG